MSDNSIETPQVDVRGPRFAAWVTTGVLIAALLVGTAGCRPQRTNGGLPTLAQRRHEIVEAELLMKWAAGNAEEN